MINNKLRQLENIFIASLITIALVTGYLVVSTANKSIDNNKTITTFKITKK